MNLSSGIRVVKAFAQEDREAMRFNARNEELWSVSVTGERTWFIFFAVMNFLIHFGMFFIWYCRRNADLEWGVDVRHTLGIHALSVANSTGRLQFFSQINNFITRAFAGAERIFEILDSRSEMFDDSDATPYPLK